MTEPDEVLRSKGITSKRETEDDVEGHRMLAKSYVEGRPSGEIMNRRLPDDSPHGESWGRSKT